MRAGRKRYSPGHGNHASFWQRGFPLPLTPSPRNICNKHTLRGAKSIHALTLLTNRGRSEMKALTTILVVGMFLTTVAIADDVDDVKAAVQRFYAALNAGDAGALMRLYAAGSTSFGAGGGLL